MYVTLKTEIGVEQVSNRQLLLAWAKSFNLQAYMATWRTCISCAYSSRYNDFLYNSENSEERNRS